TRPARLIRPAEAAREVSNRGTSFQPHLHLVAQRLAVHPERPADRGHRLGGRRAPDAGALEVDPPTIDSAQGDFRVADRLGDYELETALANEPEVAGLSMHRLAGLDRLRALGVDQKRLAVMREADLLAIAERLDARVLSLPFSAPDAEQETHRRQRRI